MIQIGKVRTTGKWVAQITLKNGMKVATKQYNTKEEVEKIVKEWLRENDIDYEYKAAN